MKFLTHVSHFFMKTCFSLFTTPISLSLFFSISVYGAFSPTHIPSLQTLPHVDLPLHEVNTNYVPELGSMDQTRNGDSFIDFENLNPEDKQTLLNELRVTHILLKRESGEHCMVDPVNNTDLIPDFITGVNEDSLTDLPPHIPRCSYEEMLLILETAERSVLEPVKVAGFPALALYSTIAAVGVGCGVELSKDEKPSHEPKQEQVPLNTDGHIKDVNEIAVDINEASKQFIQDYPFGKIKDGIDTVLTYIAGSFTCRDVVYLVRN